MLITTKLQPPPLRSLLLFRKHLIDRLCAAKGSPLILLSGPAGSGKTSLACQWIEQEKPRFAWYSLDEEDNEPDLFFRYLITSLIQAEQQLADALGPVLLNRRGLLAENVIPDLIEAVSSICHNVHLILDDFHKITHSDIHGGLLRLMKYIPPSLQVVFLSRCALPAMMEAAIVKMDCVEINAEDLKFTETETADLFKTIMPNELPVDLVRDLNRQVEGWAAGLQLIGLSLGANGAKSTELPYLLNQTHEKFASYLIHDILKVQPEKIQHFICATALLDRFNAELCAEVTGVPDAPELLDLLERKNLFLIPLDADRKWYRYHHVFSEVVRRRAASLGGDAISATLCKAALWLARNNHLEDALRCAFRSSNVEFAADLMEDYVMRYIEQFDLTTGLRWILKLPERILNQRALLRLQQCAFLFIMMEPAEVKEILASIERNGNPDFSRYSGHKLALCQDYAAYFKCMLHILYAGNTEAITHFQDLRSRFLPQSPLLVAAIEMLMVFILISNGDFTVAEAFLARVSELPLSDSGQVIRKKIFFAKANSLIARHSGRLRRAEAIILQVLQTLDRQGYGHPSMAYLLHRHLGHIFYLQDRLEEAQECAALASKHCEHSGLIDEIMAGNELRLQLHLAAGENGRAAQSIRQMQSLSVKLGMPQVAACADACAVRLAIVQGNLAAAVLWSRRRKLQPNEPFSLLFAAEALTQVRLYYARGQYTRAAHLLQILRIRCARRSLADLVLQIDILHAATLHAMHQAEMADSLLVEALAFAQTEDYFRPFVNDAGLVAPILKRIADKQPCSLSAGYLEKVLAACRMPLRRPAVPDESDQCEYENLSQREMEILEWVAQGFQNREIARKAYVSINTVKSHVRKILVKLDVKTRTQAILKARKLKILPME